MESNTLKKQGAQRVRGEEIMASTSSIEDKDLAEIWKRFVTKLDIFQIPENLCFEIISSNLESQKHLMLARSLELPVS